MTTQRPDAAAGADGGAGADATPVRKRWRLVGRWLGGLFIVGSFVFWAWAFSPWARTENPARLDNRGFAQWADQRCAEAQTVIAALPTARQADSRAERAEQVDQGTDEVEALVDDLRLRAQASLSDSTDGDGPPDAALVGDWLADWDVYVLDRRNHSDRLRTADEDTPDRELRFLLVDMTEGSTYTERMDGFSRLNNMDNCQVPGDV
ncbi:MAG: hypothetical protein F4Y05_09090 [Acidimicrobiaceae bacterium]|nr:hypothetical protein [Acidimicrobiaceae bacterium]MYE09746.1 hypothetical protein [Acidimicrobiaceae bacterium]MYH93309.1 hypothetical protein [Acidimicrobiaceae bacterium]MYI35443.1 hypothetical protein [Acidimicrobiaceae bacterium]